MSVTSVTRFNGGNRDAFMAAAKKAKAIFENVGGEFQVGQLYSGPDIGQWVATIRFADWEDYGAAMKALSSNAEYLNPHSPDDAII